MSMMKTAKEWTQERMDMEICLTYTDSPEVQLQEFADWLKQVQLDAMKEGMRKAAKISTDHDTGKDRKLETREEAILVAADNLTIDKLQ